MNLIFSSCRYMVAIVATLYVNTAVSANMEQVTDCSRSGDYICAYNELIDFIEEDPDGRPLLSQIGGGLSSLGSDLSIFFLLAEPKMKPEQVIRESERVIKHVYSLTKNPQYYRHLVPYYTLKGEACHTLKDDSCLKESANHLCEILLNQGFGWPRETKVNAPLTGKERVKEIRQYCDDKTKADPRTIQLFKRIEQYITVIKNQGELDKNIHLFLPPQKIKKLKEKDRWEKVKREYKEHLPQVLPVLRYIKNQNPEFELWIDSYAAMFDLSDYPGGTGDKAEFFRMRMTDGEWYL